MSSPLLVIAGPTGSGKSALAVAVAQLLEGEIVSADSMQIYRECDIVTAKPTAAEQEGVRHHLLDVVAPDARYSAGAFASDAEAALLQIAERNHTPILCGGTGFYLKALMQPDALPAPPASPAVRLELEAELAMVGPEGMHARLVQANPEAAERIHPNDSYRVLRALEIAATGGTTTAPAAGPPRPALVYALEWPRAELYVRLEARVDTMLQVGALNETRALLQRWGNAAPALGGVGYKELVPVLQGETELNAAVALWKQSTRRYAKRQTTWFRHQMEVQWLDAHLPLPQLARQVASEYRAFSAHS